MDTLKSSLGLGFAFAVCLLAGASNVWAECSADDQATYETCIDAAATSCSADLTDCDSTTLRTTTSAVLVNNVVDRCCTKSTQRAQLACASLRIARLVLTKSVIPANPYSNFRQAASAAIKELKALKREKTLCDTGSN